MAELTEPLRSALERVPERPEPTEAINLTTLTLVKLIIAGLVEWSPGWSMTRVNLTETGRSALKDHPNG